MTRTALAPCPFGCLPGGLATMERRSPGLPLRDQESVFVACAGCGCHGPGADSVAEARQRWNERAPDGKYDELAADRMAWLRKVDALANEVNRLRAILRPDKLYDLLIFRHGRSYSAAVDEAVAALHAAVEGARHA